MSDFYQDLANMARDLLKPATQGGFGQGIVVLKRVINGEPDTNNPWGNSTTETTETLDAVVRGIDSKMVGTTMGSTVLMASDLVVLAAVPKMTVESGDTLTIDGRNVKILSVQPIPAAGTMSAIKFFVRG